MAKKTLVIDRDPIYRNLQKELRRQIHQGDWTKGAMIPSRRALADEFQVSVPTVQKAVADMVAEGLLRVNAKRGTYVFGDPDLESENQAKLKDGSSPGLVDNGLLAPTDAHVGLMADIRPGTTLYFANGWSYIIVHEAEHALAQYGIPSRFFNLFTADRKFGKGRSSEGSATSGKALLEAILAEKPAAVILHESVILGQSPDFIHRVVEAGVLPVVVGYKNYGPECVSVMYDSTNAGYQAAKHLMDQGCQKILFFAPYRSDWVETRAAGVRLAVKSAGLSDDALRETIGLGDVETVLRHSVDIHPHIPASHTYACEVLANDPHINGVVAVNDDAAFGFIQAAEEFGWRMGTDYRIIGFDDSVESQAIGLSTLHPPCASMGREAAWVVARFLRGRNDLASVVLKSRLVVRASSSRAGAERAGASTIKGS